MSCVQQPRQLLGPHWGIGLDGASAIVVTSRLASECVLTPTSALASECVSTSPFASAMAYEPPSGAAFGVPGAALPPQAAAKRSTPTTVARVALGWIMDRSTLRRPLPAMRRSFLDT
jgi:hypothetical protein